MYTLYYSPGTCSMAVHVALIETGADFKLESASIAEGKNRTSEFLKINPRGMVPVLLDGDHPIREGGAILTYLLDKHKSPLLPREGIERATALEWLMWANASLHPAYGRYFWISKTITDEAQKKQLHQLAVQGIQKMWDDAEARLSTSKYLAGPHATIADILVTVFANWQGYVGNALSFGPNVQRLIREISQRPAFQKAMAAEHVDYTAAA